MSRHIEPFVYDDDFAKRFQEKQQEYLPRNYIPKRPNNPGSRLATQVDELSQKCQDSLSLLGEIMATFAIERNREQLAESEAGRALLEISDGWSRRYDRIIGNVCTGISANWCPIHGDCTCKDKMDKNDDDCPLHSASSTHGEIQD